jgi:hypothetical protein
MAPRELFRRQMVRKSRTFLNRFKSGKMTVPETDAIAQATGEAIPRLHFVDSTRASASPTFLHECAEEIRGDAKSLLIVVDSLHTWAKQSGYGSNEYESLNTGLLAIQMLSHDLKCPIMYLGELFE